MTYTPVVWQNLVTPVDQVHLNQMDNGIVALDTGKVDKDGVVAAASGIVQNKLAAGEATNFQLLGSGQLSWGPGGVGGALDVTLRRVAASDLKAFASYFRTSGDIIARDGLAGQGWVTSSIGGGPGRPPQSHGGRGGLLRCCPRHQPLPRVCWQPQDRRHLHRHRTGHPRFAWLGDQTLHQAATRLANARRREPR